MSAKVHKLLAWSAERDELLAAWLARGVELGVSFKAPNGQHSDAAAVGEALRRAAGCRCGERVPGVYKTGVAVLELSKAEAARFLAPTSPNPLRALRDAAGLSQAEAAARCSMTRGAWANAEKAARATPAMVERARAGLR